VRAFTDAFTAADALLALADRNVAALQARTLALAGLAAATGDPAQATEVVQDRAACLARWDDFVRRHVHFKAINILLTLPDPGPEELSRFARIIEQAQVELGRLAEEEPDTARLLGQELAQTLRVSPRLLRTDEDRAAE
jgi:hypothetical protein